MHRFGQRVKREILRPETQDYAHGTTGTEVEAEYLKSLRRRMESFEGSEIKDSVERMGPEAVYGAINATAEELAVMEKNDPEGFAKIKKVRGVALALYEEDRKPPLPPAGPNAAVDKALKQYEASKMPLSATNGHVGT